MGDVPTGLLPGLPMCELHASLTMLKYILVFTLMKKPVFHVLCLVHLLSMSLLTERIAISFCHEFSFELRRVVVGLPLSALPPGVLSSC